MYLKRLEMQGFKSFVDKTVLDFNTGITAVVGPNGSGKSNISDAVKWVLGEQSPKTLRGSRMEDVIFSGTESRKPVGVAEVSLIMENEDHLLNIAYNEVKITRRLYRSGESEYLINNAQCRMKDIHMLFADTGIGKDGYSLIGQGRVDEILNSKSEERRNIFEDASGIMKYRMRKQESERKLNATEQNLLRVSDIVSELQHQMKPLEKQAETAKQYLEYKYELRDIEVGVLVDGIDFAEEKRAKLLRNIEILSGDKVRAETALQDLQRENSEKTEKVKMLTDLIKTSSEKIYTLEKKIERLNSEIKVNREKLNSAAENQNRLLLEQEQQRQKSGAYDLHIREMKQQISDLQESSQTLAGETERAQGAYDGILRESDKAKKEAETISQSILDAKLLLGNSQSAEASYQKQLEMITARKTSIDEELSILDSTSEIAAAELKAAELEQNTIADKLIDLKQLYKNKTEALETTKRQEREKSEQSAEVSAQLQRDSARLKAIREMEDDYEGYAFSVKKVLSLCRSNPEFGKGICGAVAQIIRVPAQYETAIETALGPAYQNIVTETEENAKKAIEYLKKGRYGRATFLPLTAVNGYRLDAEKHRILNQAAGFVGVASEIVAFDPNYQKAIDTLLGRVAVFDNLDHAMQSARQNRYGFMCVTLDGDILRTSGAVTGGSTEKGRASAGTLSRTREIPELQTAVTKNDALLKTYMQEMETFRSTRIDLEASRESLSKDIQVLEIEESQWTARCTAMRDRQAGETARRGRLVEELKIQVREMLDARAAADAAKQEQAELNRRILQEEERAQTAADASARLAEALSAANQALLEQKLKEADAKSNLQKLTEELDRFESEVSESAERIAYYDTQIQDCLQTAAAIQRSNDENEILIGRTLDEKAAEEEEHAKLEQMKQELDSDLSGMLGKITEINEQITRHTDELNKAEIKKVREESEINSNKNRLWEEYELVYTAAKELTQGRRTENYAEASKRIKELKGLIKALGAVNVNAVEEYESTKERFTFLSAQRQDLVDAKAKLQKVIADLNGVMRRQFTEQFYKIRENFKVVFQELFGGGKADIVLDETQDVLECGIEIQVQPPGKKLQNMLLLSGGERALTAIALLFGILKMHPSPFCLLDEIEAALDDANVYRLSEYVKKIENDMQFIMITHRKGTMESAASLYGVTMEEKGISKVISLKMNA